MAEYQVLARRYRPQTFAEVFGQESIVTTLKNAITHRRLAHAYLFCGSRGTGKTTLARIFAKALNCQTERPDLEPCNHCSSCREITSGSSMDVLEIDGASNRGIDDVRQITETVSYAAAAGGYKIYIIDEVHMLTKEAFNALLKTLEEPPPRVIFCFATTEPHKVPPTILSRCQRYNLQRISPEKIVKKLTFIAEKQEAQITEEALYAVAARAEGGMRDAESLLDQILAFHEGAITAESVADFLGVVPGELFFKLDQAAKDHDLAAAFEITHQVFTQGKDLLHFVESLTEHFRTLLLVKIATPNAPFLTLSAANSQKYVESTKIYTQEQCLTILDFLIEALGQMRSMPSNRIALEALLLRILRVKQRIPVEFLIRQLQELEQKIGNASETDATEAPRAVEIKAPLVVPKPTVTLATALERVPVIVTATPPISMPSPIVAAAIVTELSITIDPTPTLKELGILSAKKPKEESPKTKVEAAPIPHAMTASAPVELGARPTEEAKASAAKKQGRYDTLLHFAAIELEGSVQKTIIKGF